MLGMEIQRAKRSMEMLAVTLKKRQEQGEEEDTASEDQEQINCETRAETGISGKRIPSLSRKRKIVVIILYERE